MFKALNTWMVLLVNQIKPTAFRELTEHFINKSQLFFSCFTEIMITKRSMMILKYKLM